MFALRFSRSRVCRTLPGGTALFGLVLTAVLLTLPLASGCSASPSPSAPEQPESEFNQVDDTYEDTTPEKPDAPDATQPTDPASNLDKQVAEKVAGLTLEQKVAQLFVVPPEAITGVGTATQAGPATEAALAQYPVGGLVYFQKNLLDPAQTKELTANSQRYAQEACGLPLFIGVDEEGGTVARVGGNPGFAVENPGNMADVGATGDTDQARTVAANIGSYLSDLGFNLDFAPDADICGDPATDVMALRSFGTDPNLVGRMVAAQVEGFTSAGMLCSAKHFPGIGGLSVDSHECAIVNNKSLDDLRTHELVPFKAAIDAGVPLIMVGHLTLPAITGDNVPASLNPAIINGILRDELGYQGLVITDSLGMGAVDGVCTPDQAGVTAVRSGADLVLMPADFLAAYEGLLTAVRTGDIPESRIDESLTRIVKAKLEFLV
ncbi:MULTISPECIES: glycoside hydrolase family 3 protein [Gordonibacter]|uniref:beta-N-acetylhexosaminidase n=1 Tax=Gordonibacter faecis TaxID=3047475 RepID=A0ABT7DJX7_9ACTN|nr:MULTISPECIES: glycoside hydrolase family 3 protein [unclassified Gordonibacter]MDJ1649821.1 glycoside hydrolase family 3 protein [Gordonibacter sp. KGMB12511]HIW75486.1 glycoside hydrolase family 3 protein [Candidatus Gordonibacter avicola]